LGRGGEREERSGETEDDGKRRNGRLIRLLHGNEA